MNPPLNKPCLKCLELTYWLLRAYQSGHREGWEPGPSTDDTMDGILDVLANAGYDPKDDNAVSLLRDYPTTCKGAGVTR